MVPVKDDNAVLRHLLPGTFVNNFEDCYHIAYRWFCGFELNDAIPDHSTFSKTRMRKWQQSYLFQKVSIKM